MIIKKIPFVLLAYILSTQAFAGRMADYDVGSYPVVATLNLGPAWSRPGESQVLTLQPGIQKAYIPIPVSRTIRLVSTAEGTDTLFTGEFFLGLYGDMNSAVTVQVGAAVSASTQVKLKGTIYEDSNISFGNYNYSYGVRNTRASLKAKFVYDPHYYELLPYVSGSAGVSFNHSSGFTIISRLPEEVPAPSFSDKGTTAFAYTLGAGLETYLDDNWRIGLGYEFADWGRSTLGIAIGQTVGKSGPSVKSLRTHELQLGLSYIA